MKITSFYTLPNGDSKFKEVEINFPDSRQDEFGYTLRLSQSYASPKVQFVELPEGMDQGWHRAPARQIVVVLSGVIEVETTDGQKRRWHAGQVFMPADIDGTGHRTRCIGGAVRVMFAPLPEGFEFG